jgi:hypothetical protein
MAPASAPAAPRSARAVLVLALAFLAAPHAHDGAAPGRASRAADTGRAAAGTGNAAVPRRLQAAFARARSVPRFIAPPAARPFPGLPAHTPAAPELLHDMEDRDPAWAPAMEAAFTSVALSRALFAQLGLDELKVTALDCRQTTCALTYEYPTRLVERVVASGLPPSSPMVLVEDAVGWTAPRGGGLRSQRFERGGEAWTRTSLVLGFDEASWDPAGYRRWVSERLPEAQAFYRRAREQRGRGLHDAG